MPDLQFAYQDPLDWDDGHAVLDIISAHNKHCGALDDERPQQAVYLRDAEGVTQGGVLYQLAWGVATVMLLAVAEAQRGQGWGTRLLAMVEEQARAEGCGTIVLDTLSFQARPFYEKLGFHVFGAFTSPDGKYTRYWMAKTL
jgi:GNAT superfamily N-acetyltransferase